MATKTNHLLADFGSTFNLYEKRPNQQLQFKDGIEQDFQVVYDDINTAAAKYAEMHNLDYPKVETPPKQKIEKTKTDSEKIIERFFLVGLLFVIILMILKAFDKKNGGANE